MVDFFFFQAWDSLMKIFSVEDFKLVHFNNNFKQVLREMLIDQKLWLE